MSGLMSVQFVLLALWILVLFISFAFGKYNEDRTRHDIRPLLMVSSALLVVMAGLFWWGGAQGTAASAFSLLIALGMFVSLLGDLMLAGYIRTPRPVMFGILVFGAAHILYIGGYVIAGRALGLAGGPTQWLVVAGFLILGLLLWAALVRSPQGSRVLGYGALGYTLLISVMAGLAVWLAMSETQLWPLALGAILFLASDAILGNQIFRKNRWFLMSDVVWGLYIGGQALIVWSNLIVLSL